MRPDSNGIPAPRRGCVGIEKVDSVEFKILTIPWPGMKLAKIGGFRCNPSPIRISWTPVAQRAMQSPNTIEVIVVEDDELDSEFLEATFRAAAERDPSHRVFRLNRAATLADALKLVSRLRFDCALLDLNLPDSRGLQTFRKFHAVAPELAVIVLTGDDDRTQAVAAVEGGAQDYLFKGEISGPLITRAILFAIERRRARQDLEDRVEERTMELIRTNLFLEREIKSRKRLERAVLDAGERERRAIGSDLHDGLAQRLDGISHLCNALHNNLENGALAQSRDSARIKELLSSAVRETRDIARGLHPVDTLPGGLGRALKALSLEIESIYGVDCESDQIAVLPEWLNLEVSTHMYRIAQEAARNSIKHGRASKLSICLRDDGAEVSLEVADNGGGIKYPANSHSGMGFKSMHYRAGAIGGDLAVESVDPHGVKIRCVVPSNALRRKSAGTLPK